MIMGMQDGMDWWRIQVWLCACAMCMAYNVLLFSLQVLFYSTKDFSLLKWILEYCKDLEETWEIYFCLSIAAGKRETWEMEEGYKHSWCTILISSGGGHIEHRHEWWFLKELNRHLLCCTRSTPIIDLNPLGFYSHVNVCSITYKWE